MTAHLSVLVHAVDVIGKGSSQWGSHGATVILQVQTGFVTGV